MKRLLRSLSRVEAWLVLHHLQAAGIRAHVFNANLSSIVGDLPPDVAMPEVWIENPRDEERAIAIVESLRTDDVGGPPQACKACGEESPANFDLCWKCGRSL